MVSFLLCCASLCFASGLLCFAVLCFVSLCLAVPCFRFALQTHPPPAWPYLSPNTAVDQPIIFTLTPEDTMLILTRLSVPPSNLTLACFSLFVFQAGGDMFASARVGKVPARAGVGVRSPASDDVSICMAVSVFLFEAVYDGVTW